MMGLYKKNGEWIGTIATDRGPLPIRTGKTDRHEAEKIIYKKQAAYNNAMAIEQRKRGGE